MDLLIQDLLKNILRLHKLYMRMAKDNAVAYSDRFIIVNDTLIDTYKDLTYSLKKLDEILRCSNRVSADSIAISNYYANTFK